MLLHCADVNHIRLRVVAGRALFIQPKVRSGASLCSLNDLMTSADAHVKYLPRTAAAPVKTLTRFCHVCRLCNVRRTAA